MMKNLIIKNILILLALTYSFTVEVSAQEAKMKFRKGWNFFSIPVDRDVTIYELAQRCSTHFYPTAWEWNASERKYINSDTFALGKGYWVLSMGSCEFDLPGNQIPEVKDFDRKLASGWNIIGSFSKAYSFNDLRVQGDCGIKESYSYEFDEGLLRRVWKKLTGVDQGYKAYWVLTTKACTMNPSPPPNPKNLNLITPEAVGVIASWENGFGSTAGFNISIKEGQVAPTMEECKNSSLKTTGLRHEFSGLKPMTDYSVRLCSYDSYPAVGYSEGIVATVKTPEAKVTGLKCQSTSSQSRYTWSGHQGVEYYYVLAKGKPNTFSVPFCNSANARAFPAYNLTSSNNGLWKAILSGQVSGINQEFNTQYKVRVCAKNPNSYSSGQILKIDFGSRFNGYKNKCALSF
jgi:hypothetical protein